MKKILFVGNSFVYYNDLPGMLTQLTEKMPEQLKCDSVTKGGAYLHQYADPNHMLHEKLVDTYVQSKWDAIILQDQSYNPVRLPEDLLKAARDLRKVFDQGEPLYFYQTWAYEEGTMKLQNTGKRYLDMYAGLKAGYLNAAVKLGGKLVPVGDAFLLAKMECPEIELYRYDHYHPSLAGTYLIACVFYACLSGRSPLELSDYEGLCPEEAAKLREVAEKLRCTCSCF